MTEDRAGIAYDRGAAARLTSISEPPRSRRASAMGEKGPRFGPTRVAAPAAAACAHSHKHDGGRQGHDSETVFSAFRLEHNSRALQRRRKNQKESRGCQGDVNGDSSDEANTTTHLCEVVSAAAVLQRAPDERGRPPQRSLR